MLSPYNNSHNKKKPIKKQTNELFLKMYSLLATITKNKKKPINKQTNELFLKMYSLLVTITKNKYKQNSIFVIWTMKVIY